MKPTRLEFVEGSSSKFWEVSTAGATMTVRFGKIGTDGQVSAKKLASPAAAEAEANKMIAEKTKKGYAPAGGGDKKSAKSADKGADKSASEKPAAKKGTPKDLKAAIKESLKAQKARLAKIPDGMSLANLLETVDEGGATLKEIYAELIDDLDRSANFAMLLGIAGALDKEPPLVVPKKLSLKFANASVKVYQGDVHVKGDFEFSQDVVVMGDLVVDGVISDEYEYMSLLVSGSVRARAIKASHKLWSGGKVEAEVIVVDQGGTVYGEDGVEAKIIVVNSDDSRVTNGKAATFIDGAEMMSKPAKAMAKLKKVLKPACFAESDDEIFEAFPMFELIRKGKAWQV